MNGPFPPPELPAVFNIVGQVIQLNLQASPADWQGLFDQLEIWKSTTGRDGPYVEMTAAQWAPPTFPFDLYNVAPPSPSQTGAQVSVVGLELQLLVDEQVPINITFTGVNPLTMSQAAAQIVSQSHQQLQSFVWTDGRLVLVGVQPGNASILHVLSGDAAPILGLPTTVPDSVAYGKDNRLELLQGQSTYAFTDYHGDPSYWYKTRYRQQATGNVGNFSLPFAARKSAIVSSQSLVTATLDLVDAAGVPVCGREVIISNKFGGTVLPNDVGVVPRTLRQLTDANGHVQFQLVRGLEVMVAIAGTQLVRDVTVPTDPTVTSFSLLDPSVGENDVFVVQVPNVDFVVRRHL